MSSVENNVGHIKPFWNLDLIKSIDYKLDHHKDTELINQYVRSGHHRDYIQLWNYFEPNPMPVNVTLFNKFWPELTCISVAINKFTPGQYLPLHKDLYGRYSKLHNITNSSQIKRIIIMIEDGYPGQLFQVNNQVWSGWSAGDWISWTGEEPHAAYNFSMNDRYAWQITGVSV